MNSRVYLTNANDTFWRKPKDSIIESSTPKNFFSVHLHIPARGSSRYPSRAARCTCQEQLPSPVKGISIYPPGAAPHTCQGHLHIPARGSSDTRQEQLSHLSGGISHIPQGQLYPAFRGNSYTLQGKRIKLKKNKQSQVSACS